MLDEGGFVYGNFEQGIWVKTALWHTASVIFKACCHYSCMFCFQFKHNFPITAYLQAVRFNFRK